MILILIGKDTRSMILKTVLELSKDDRWAPPGYVCIDEE
jgi:hypothetical protein